MRAYIIFSGKKMENFYISLLSYDVTVISCNNQPNNIKIIYSFISCLLRQTVKTTTEPYKNNRADKILNQDKFMNQIQCSSHED